MARPGSHLSPHHPPRIPDNGWLVAGEWEDVYWRGYFSYCEVCLFVTAEHHSMSFYLQGTTLTDLFPTMSEQVGVQCLAQGSFNKTRDRCWNQTN